MTQTIEERRPPQAGEVESRTLHRPSPEAPSTAGQVTQEGAVPGGSRFPGTEPALIALWAVLGAGLLYLAALPVELSAQAVLAAALLAAVFVMRRLDLGPTGRIVLLLLGSHLTLRYFFWRTTHTLGYHGPFSFGAALALYLAELYGAVVYLLGIFVNIQPLERRSVPLPENLAELPAVDVLVPSYNESADLLEITLIAASQIDYPESKLNVYLLDDGGTVQKRNDSDPEKAAEAAARHEELKDLCRRIGVHYLTREKNDHAKAGNVNAALEHIGGDLVLILDADHVPTIDILQNTAGLFLRDPKLFLVQTPHYFINPDPIEKNLGTFQRMPAENEMFYGVIQKGLDFWGASFFCGSAALIRRSCLDEIGGISGITITEDAETALDLHARGYHSAYLATPMISGLQPETFTGFVVQRVRWAQGMVQIFLLKNPLLRPGLTLSQRLCYLNSSFFWFFSYARVVFMLAPAALLIFGLRVYDANLPQFLAYAVPHVIAALVISNVLFGKVRWTLVSELYELMQSLFSLSGIIKVFLHPRAPTFIVTPKGEHLEKDFISPLSRPFYILTGIALLAAACGVLRLLFTSQDQDAVWITMGWNLFNIMLLLGGLGALHEKRQVRASPRVLCDRPGDLLLGRQVFPCHVEDVSVGGAGLRIDDPQGVAVEPPSRGFLRVCIPSLGRTCLLPATVRYAGGRGGAGIKVGLQFTKTTLEEKADIVALVHGDNEGWRKVLESREGRKGIRGGALVLISLGAREAGRHLAALARGGLRLCVNAPKRWSALALRAFGRRGSPKVGSEPRPAEEG